MRMQGKIIPTNASSGATFHTTSGNNVYSPSQSLVSVQLTPFSIVQPSDSTKLITYQPAVTSTTIGATVPFDISKFNHLDPHGFEVLFEFSRNTFTIQRYLHYV
jgi:hypothetical protein